MNTLYITQNGITDHIGQSQVAPYILGLAKLGHRFHILSAEKSGREALIDHYQKIFDSAGIRWTRVQYHNKPPLVSAFYDFIRMYAAASRIIKREGIQLVHCRSFPAALMGFHLKRTLAIKYIFDFRDFYADGGLTNKPFKFVYRYLKRREGPMIQSADKIVCLTHSARAKLSDWYLTAAPKSDSRIHVIPCCADFQHYDLSRLSQADRQSAMQKARLSPADFVLLYLGSLGPDYLLKHMMSLFKQVLAVRPNARFLFVSNNGKELVDAECGAQGIAHERVRFLTADRDEIPAFLSLADIAVVFIRGDLSKAGCSPIKVAELFACNVPLITNTGVGDLDTIISLQRNGSFVVNDFSEKSLRAAVEMVLAVKEAGGVNIRENSREFGVDEGITRYAAVYRELLPNSDS